MSARPPWAAADAALPVVPGFRLLRPLGEGAHGQVHLAEVLRGPLQGRAVALKLLPASRVNSERLRAQTRALLGLRHPAINALLAAGEHPGGWWLALHLVPGHDLRVHTQARHRLPAALVARLGAHLTDGLAQAHRVGIVHRDIKPSNVLVHWPSEVVQLADFGLAHLSDGQPSATGVVPGTPAYMAPEVLAGEAASDRSDVHALAALLYELLSGARPYTGHTLGELLVQVGKERPQALRAHRPDLPLPWTAVFDSALSPLPRQRPSAEALAAQLRELAADPAAAHL